MISKIKYSLMVMLAAITLVGCTKDDNTLDPAGNTATAASTALSLNNRVFSGFVLDSSSIKNLPAGSLPAAGTYNKFRKLLTYDTLAAANKPVVYSAGDVLTVIAYMKGDDSAIAKRRINFRFFQPPASFVTPTAISPIQRAEDFYRGFAPATADVLNTVSSTSITNASAPFMVTKVATETSGGVNVNTYLIKLTYTIPVALAGKLISINLSANTSGAASDLGNVNWIYAFRVR